MVSLYCCRGVDCGSSDSPLLTAAIWSISAVSDDSCRFLLSEQAVG